MKKYEVSIGKPLDKNPDWTIASGPNNGKTVDAMYTTDNLTQKEIDGLNKFYEKNMTVVKRAEELLPEIQNIQKHFNQADFVPIDFRVLNEKKSEYFFKLCQDITRVATK